MNPGGRPKKYAIPDVGARFGSWTVVEQRVKMTTDYGHGCKCKCVCGITRVILPSRLQSTQSCGCKRYEALRVNITGQRSGKLTAIKPSTKTDRRGAIWECLCDCGETRNVRAEAFRRHAVKSCGCSNQFSRRGREEAKDRLDRARAVRCGCGLILPHDPEDRVRTCTPVENPVWLRFAYEWGAKMMGEKLVLTRNEPAPTVST